MKILILLLLIAIIPGCSKKETGNPPEKINYNNFRLLVSKAVNKDIIANNKLSNLVEYSLTTGERYNKIITDSIISGGRNFYFALLENPNPMFTRLAVYDSVLNPLFIDKSLNGNIYVDKLNKAGKTLIKTDEAYLSKDTLLLNRVSFYTPNSLIFRTHTKFVKQGREFFQDIIEISDTLIKTKIKGPLRFPLNNEEDLFRYNISEKKYISGKNLFDKFIKKEIEIFDYMPVKKSLHP